MAWTTNGIKSTNAELERRIDLVADYLRENPIASKEKLHKKFCPKFKVHWRTVDIYIARARKILHKEATMPIEKYRKIGVGILLNLLNHPKNAGIRIKAEARLAAIMGYDAPTQTRLGNPDGTPIQASVVAPLVQFVLPDDKNHGDAIEIEGKNGHKKLEDKNEKK